MRNNSILYLCVYSYIKPDDVPLGQNM